MIYYRISSRPSVNAPPKFEGDKMRIVKTCLRSFKETNPTEPIHFILDYCSSDYLDVVKSLFPKFTHEFSQYGNYNSCLKTYNLARETKDKYLFFIEDDYMWKSDAFEKMMKALDGGIKLLSPYDHPDFYENKDAHPGPFNIVWKGHHWRTAHSNTMTFACHREVFDKNRGLFNEHGPNDSILWRSMPEKLWCPIPSLATHFVRDHLAKGWVL
jgi:hypothetical protein